MSVIDLTEEQKKCINTVGDAYKRGNLKMSITGPAGSGKSTIIPHLIDYLNIDETDVVFLAPTGVAASVLKRKGVNARTLHSFVYRSIYSEQFKKFINIPKTIDQLSAYPRIIIVDEVGMCRKKDLEILESFEIPVIGLGDPNQLPPIEGGINEYVKNPTFELTEVHRQSADSEIIQFSEKIRKTKLYDKEYGEDGEVMSVPREKLSISMLNWADQVLVPTLAEQNGINNTLRKHLGFEEEYPELGDKVIFTQNYWNIESDQGEFLVNGTIGYITMISYFDLNSFAPFALATVVPEFNEDDKFHVRIDLSNFFGLAPFKNSKRETRVVCEFAYAITIHKSQGSEWDKVLVLAERLFGEKSKMAYTAATRAKERLVWVT